MKPGDQFMAPIGVVTLIKEGHYVSQISYTNSLGEDIQTVCDTVKLHQWPKMGDMRGSQCPESDVKKGEI